MNKKKDLGAKVVTLSMFLNIGLLLLKGIVGLATGSTALKADAVNSAGDTISTLAILFGIRYAMRPIDEDYHYGYGKMESLMSLIVGIIILASTGYLWYSIVQTISTKSFSDGNIWALLAAALSLVVKIYLYLKTRSVGKKINSIAVMTNSIDHRNDAIATIGTVVAISLALIGSRFNVSIFKYAESVAAAITSVFIIKAGIDIISSSTKMLLDAAPDDATLESLEKTVEKVDGVLDLDWLKARNIGRGLLVDVAVEVDADLSIKEGHKIDERIIRTIRRKFKTVLEVQVQINPDE